MLSFFIKALRRVLMNLGSVGAELIEFYCRKKKIHSLPICHQNHNFPISRVSILRRSLECTDCPIDGMGSICCVTLESNIVHSCL